MFQPKKSPICTFKAKRIQDNPLEHFSDHPLLNHKCHASPGNFQSSKRKQRLALAKLNKKHLSLISFRTMLSIKTSSNLFCNQVQHINLHLFFLKISKMVFILSFKNFQEFFSSIFLGNYTEVERLREKVLLHLLVIVDYCPRIPPKSNEKLLNKLY